MASGSGTNLQALIDHEAVRPHLVHVISDNPSAPALQRAGSAGIGTSVLEWADFGTREAFSHAVMDRIESVGSDLVVLAGFMRVLSPSAVDRFRGTIINIHPSLLPAFPGMKAVDQALDHGVRVTGVTVHYVDEGVDSGPIIAQRAVVVDPTDDRASLHARIQAEEHVLLPEVVLQMINGRIGAEAR